MPSTHRSADFSFPLWQFLTQPVSRSTRMILNPIRFWNHYNVQRLEQCWNYDPVQLLERCWAKEPELENLQIGLLENTQTLFLDWIAQHSIFEGDPVDEQLL